MTTETKIALVTGANKGIGLETARQLAQQGIRVLLGARDEVRGQEAVQKLYEEGLDVHFCHLDVTDQATVDAAAKRIEADYGKLDILVNNAGISSPQDGPPSTAEEQAFRQLYEVNVFGVFRVTQALLPLLKKAEAARVVNVSSNLASLASVSDRAGQYWSRPVTWLTAYSSSKAALNAITVQLAAELQDTPIKVNASAPIYTATDLNGFEGTHSVEEGAKASVELALIGEDGPTAAFYGNDGPVPW